MKSLAKKLAEVMGSVSGLKKDGTNTHHKFKFVSHDNVVNHVREAMANAGIGFTAEVVGVSEMGKNILAEVRYTLTDTETGEVKECSFFGMGSDNQDKALYKAVTQAKKMFLLNTFLIPTGDQYADGDYGHGYETPSHNGRKKQESRPEPKEQMFRDLPKERQEKARKQFFATAKDLGQDAHELAGHLLGYDQQKQRGSLSVSTVKQVSEAINFLKAKLADATPFPDAKPATAGAAAGLRAGSEKRTYPDAAQKLIDQQQTA